MIHSIIRAQQRRLRGGFTLIETLIYGAGLVIVLGGMAAFLFYLYAWYRSATVPARADAAGLALASQIAADIRAANTVNALSSAFNTKNGVVSVTSSSGANSTTTVYSLQNGAILEKVGTAATTTVSASDIWVSGFYATLLSNSNSSAVRFELDVDYHLSSGTTTMKYADMAILRQSY